MTGKNSSMALENSLRKAKMEKEHIFDGRVRFQTVTDHILESVCRHDETGNNCQVCRFEKELGLPQLPEMIFPNNKLSLSFLCGGNDASSDRDNESSSLIVEFNAFDALNEVDKTKLPEVKVGPSAAWREARKEMPVRDFQQPFDWTFTTPYRGTLGTGVRVEDVADEQKERINFERLKQPDPILFYDEFTLYEDELGDHGCAMMTVRVRVMPNTFLALCRFYLRVDHVVVRICDTRLYAESGWNHVIREWTHREAHQLPGAELENTLKPDLLANSLPLIEKEVKKIVMLA